MNTQEVQKTYSEKSQSYSFKHACMVTVPIILRVPLSVEPIVVPNDPVCHQKQNGYEKYDEQLMKVN